MKLPWGKRIWAWRHGFVCADMLLYNFDQYKVEDFLPEFPYMRAHPLNGSFSCLIDNKLNLRYVLHPFSAYLPQYYLLLRRGRTIRLVDETSDKPSGQAAEVVLDLCRQKGRLVIKPLNGENGQGVWIVQFEAGRYVVNGETLGVEEFTARVRSLHNHLVMEYIQQDDYAEKLFPRTLNTIRILSMWDYEQQVPFIAAAFHRVGSNSSVPVDNCILGGLTCSIDMASGVLGPGVPKPDGGSLVWLKIHPDTGSPIQGVTIPHWEGVKSGVIDIAGYLPMVPYMGWDIAGY